MKHQLSLAILIIALLFACTSSTEKKKEVDTPQLVKVDTANNKKVFSYHIKEEFESFIKLQLDSTHVNLLNPQVAKSSYIEVSKAWIKLHTDIGDFLSDKNFQWNSTDSSIQVFHKIYFDESGHIKTHFFNVVSETVSASSKEKFSDLLKEFGASYQVELKREEPFAQCGKTRYEN